MSTPGAGRDEYSYGYQGYGAGPNGTIIGRANATRPESQNNASSPQNYQGYAQVASHPHQGYNEASTLGHAGVVVSGHHGGYNQLRQFQTVSSGISSNRETFQGDNSPSSYAVSHQYTYPQTNSNQNYLAGPLSDVSVAGSQSQASNSYARPSISHGSRSQPGRTTYRRRPIQARDGSDEGMSDGDEDSPNIPLQEHIGSDFSNLSTHSRRKMYVAGLEGYLTGSRETLMRNGHDLPRVQRATTSKGLNGPVKIDMLTKMERRNADLRAATRLKEESSDMAYRSKPKS